MDENGQYLEETEEEADIEQIDSELIRKLLLSSTDWTVDTIVNQLRRGNINISPRFQRRDAWDVRRKSKFVESLILNFPIPEIVLADQREFKNRFIVLDGKQRLTALLSFMNPDQGESGVEGFRLKGLEILTHLNGVGFKELESVGDFRDEYDSLMNQTVRTVVVRNWQRESLIYAIFIRLNTTSVPLSPQELRQALYPGPFTDFLDQTSADSVQLRNYLSLTVPDFRMRDVEILLRFYAFRFFMEQYAGNMSAFLNYTARRLNDSFDELKPSILHSAEVFEGAMIALQQIFETQNVARRWIGSKYDGSRNRALLDVLLYYFTIPEIREIALQNADGVTQAYKKLFEDPIFRESVGSTTKSLTATYNRFRLWAGALEEVLETSIPVPELVNNRLVPSILP